MADETTATFGIELRDGVTAPAQTAGSALDQFKARILGGTSELRRIQAAMARLKSGGLGGSEAFKRLRDQSDALKKSIASSQSSFLALGGNLADLKPDKPTNGLKALLGEAAKMPGPLGAGARSLVGLMGGGSMAAIGMLGAVAAALAVVAAMATLVVAVGQATVALFQYGLAAAEARRNELLHLEGVVSIRSWYSRAAGSATELQAAIDRVSGSAAISRTRVAGYAEQLYRAGLRGATLEDALRGMTTVAAVQGEAMAARFRGMAVGAARTGGSVRALADDVDRRLGGTARRMGLSWERQMERLRESFGALFDDLELDGALGALDRVLSLFSQTTVTGRALRGILTALFQPVLDGVEGVDDPVRDFFEGAVLATQRLTIGFLRLRNWMNRTFGGDASGLGNFVNWANVGTVAVALFAVAVLTAVGTLALLAAIILLPIAALLALGFAAGYAIGWVIEQFGELGDWLGDVDWSELGGNLIDGLVDGITGGVSAVWGAVTSLGDSMTGALRDALDIHSPSRVFAEIGRMIPRGLAVGVEAEARVSSGAVEDLGSVPSGGAVGGGGRGRGVGAVYVSIDRIDVSAGSHEEVPTNLADRIREAVEEALLGVLVETGGADA